MEVGSPVGEDDSECNGTDFVEISKIFAMQDLFSLRRYHLTEFGLSVTPLSILSNKILVQEFVLKQEARHVGENTFGGTAIHAILSSQACKS